VKKLLREIHLSAAPQTTPSQAVLTRLIETMLFASMETEEGHLTPVGIVFAESFAPFHAGRSHWEFVRFASHQLFDVSQIAKLASACGSLDSLLDAFPSVHRTSALCLSLRYVSAEPRRASGAGPEALQPPASGEAALDGWGALRRPGGFRALARAGGAVLSCPRP
jgi:hypothetical protein